ncbi:putative Pfs NACHT and ankyrin domain-containing protein [Trichoderma barbatum]
MHRRPTFARNTSFGQPRRSSTINSTYSSRGQDDCPFYGDAESTTWQAEGTEQDHIEFQAQEKTLIGLASWRSKISKLTPKQQALFLQDSQLESFQNYASKLQQAIQKRMDDSKFFEFTRKIKPFYDLVKLVTPIVSEASQAFPIPPGAILGGITCILSLGVRLDDYQAKIMETLASMAGELSILDKYRAESLFANDPDIQASQIEIAADILDFCITAAKIFFDDNGKEKKGLIVFLKAQLKDFDDTFHDIMAGFQRHVIELDKLITLANSRRLRLIHRSVAAADESNHIERRRMMAEMKNADHRRATDEKRSQFLNWLPSLPGGKIQEDTYERRVKGTGEWLMEHPVFKYWLEEPASTLLWIHGKPGCGKSHLASRLIHDLGTHNSGPDSALSYLYCSSTQYNVKMDLNSLLGSLLAQLCLRLTANEIENILQIAMSGTKESPSRAQMKEWVHAVLEKFQLCYIVIDGLDECSDFPDKQLEDFCTFIASLVEHKISPPHIKVVIFSRPRYQTIDRVFSRFPQIRVDDGANENDIKSYISEKVDEVNLDPSPEEYEGFEEIKELMLNQAGGTFLWVRLKVKDFKEIGSVDDIKEALQDPVEGLDEIYGQTIRKILGRPKYSRDRALRALLWVANAYRSLSKVELLEVLSTKPGQSGLNARQRLSLDLPLSTECFDLIVDVDGYYQLMHASLKDFLLSQAPSLSIGGKDQINAHDMLAETCLTYLNFDVFHQVSKLSLDSLEKLLKEHPLLEYAACFWGYHFASANGRQAEPTNRLLARLLQTETLVALCIDILEIDELGRGRLSQSSTATPLHLLTIFNLRSVVETMPELQVHINTHDQFLHLPIDYAMIYESTDMAVWLLDIYRRQDRELFATCLDCCQTRLLKPSIGNDWGDIVESLLSLGAGTNLRNSQDITMFPLEFALIQGAHSALDALLKAGLSPESGNPKGPPPLALAAGMGDLEAVKRLLAAGADVDRVGSDGRTALHDAARYGDPDVILELLKKVPEIMCFTFKGCATALHLAAYHGCLEAVERLLEYCQDIKFLDALDYDGNTALRLALRFSDLSIAQRILEYGSRHDLNEWAQVVPTRFFSELCKQYVDTCGVVNSRSRIVIETLRSVSEAEIQKPAEQVDSHPETTTIARALTEAMSDGGDLPASEDLYTILIEALTPLLERQITKSVSKTPRAEGEEEEEEDGLDVQVKMAYDMSWRLSRAILGQEMGEDIVEAARSEIGIRLEIGLKEEITRDTSPMEGNCGTDDGTDAELGHKSSENANKIFTNISDSKVMKEAMVETRTQHAAQKRRPYKRERRGGDPYQGIYFSAISDQELANRRATTKWTEVPRGYVIAEALEELGYQFWTLDFGFGVDGYLGNEEIDELVKLSYEMVSAQAALIEKN